MKPNDVDKFFKIFINENPHIIRNIITHLQYIEMKDGYCDVLDSFNDWLTNYIFL